jgi:hypothetical protein
MADMLVETRRRRASVVAFALSVTVAVPASSFAAQKDAEFVAGPRCAAVENSPLAEPEWYAAECVAPRPEAAPARSAAGQRPPGDLFYLHNIRNAGNPPQSVYTSPIPTYNFTLLGPNNLPIFAMDFDNGATTLWGINNTTRGLGTYNLTTGAFTQTVVTTGIPAAETISGLKFDPTSSLVYVNSTLNLYTIDLTTGVCTLVGPFTHAPAAVIDIAISPTGQMYGEDLNDNFYSINKATGATTLIGPTGYAINFAQGMDFDNGDGVLYQFAYQGGGVNSLRTINLATGASTEVFPAPLGPEHEGAVRVSAMSADPAALAVDASGNGVYQPNETVSVAPSWTNSGSGAVALTGALTNHTGPAGATYSIPDGAADYGTIAGGATASCTATGNCYQVSNTSATRPAVHWDSQALETITPSIAPPQTWTLHIGESFTDVPPGPFFRFIETLLHNGVTGGCTTTTYCPTASTTRAQMAVFVLISREGASYSPPACVSPNLFSDVPDTSPFCRWIEELANRQVVAGCGGTQYCPSDPVSREQMAVFVLRTLDPTLNPPACVAGQEQFGDVASTSPFCRWIEELANRQVVTGCGGGNYCPTTPVSREQMGVFLAVTFGLSLYGL